MDIDAVVADLRAESESLDAIVADLSEAEWRRETPAAGWTIAHQIAHLAWTDHQSLLALTDPPAFQEALAAALTDPASFVDRGAERTLTEPSVLLGQWRAWREGLAQALVSVPMGQKIDWFGPPMSPASMATARIMETWAHGLDVADALGITREPTTRLRHVAFLGHRTLGFAFAVRGRPIPAVPVRLELSGVDGTQWTYGPVDAADRVTGPALDFCLLATQRRHRSDLALVAIGPVADEWLDIAQAFAGLPGSGRPPATGHAGDLGGAGGTASVENPGSAGSTG